MHMRTGSRTLTLKIAILSIAFVTLIGNSASAVLGPLQEAFPDVPETMIQCFVTYPQLMNMIFSLVGGILVTLFDATLLIILDVVVFTAAGMAPMFLTDFNAMLVSRLLYGICLGMLSPIAVGLITRHYAGDDRAFMMGMQFSVGNIGQTISMFGVGALLRLGWRQTFILYALGIVTLVLVILYLPHGEIKKAPVRRKGGTFSTMRVSAGVLWVALMMLLYNTCFITIYTNLSLIIRKEGLASDSFAGYALAVMTLAGMLSSMFFGRLFRKTGLILGGFAMLATAAGMLLLAAAGSVAGICTALIIIGTGNALLIPYFNFHIGYFSPEGSEFFCISLVTAIHRFGIFCSPFLFAMILERFLRSTNARLIFRLVSAVYVFLMLLLFIYAIFIKRREEKYGPHTSEEA